MQLFQSSYKKRMSVLDITHNLNTSITVESQALEIARALQRKGFEIVIYDPSRAQNAKRRLKKVKFADNLRKRFPDGEIVFISVIPQLLLICGKCRFIRNCLANKLFMDKCVGEKREENTCNRRWWVYRKPHGQISKGYGFLGSRSGHQGT